VKLIAFKSPARGTTLIETIIAAALSIFILAGMLQIMNGTRQTNRLEEALTDLQETGRFAIDSLSETVSYRGFQGCLMPVTLSVTDEDNINWNNVIYTQPRALNFPSTNIAQTSLRGFEVSATGNWTPDPSLSASNNDILALKNNAGITPIAGSDIISIQYADPDGAPLSSNMNNPSSDVVIDDTSMSIEQDDLVFVGDCAQGDLFRVSNTPSSAAPIALEHSISANSVNTLRRAYTVDAQVRRFHVDTFFIADTGRNNINGKSILALYKYDAAGNTQELIEGVENLQILYGEQLANGSIGYRSSSDASLSMRKVVSVQLGLLVTSPVEAAPQIDTTTYALPGENIGVSTTIAHSGGKFFRKIFSRTVQLRNRS
jgi:type IV pilus assembly protein PilW